MLETSIASASYASIALTAAFTIPPIFRLTKRPFLTAVKSTNEDALYEDEDGVATEESMARFSNRRLYTLILAISVLGLATSFTTAVSAAVRRGNDFEKFCLVQLWLLFASWVNLDSMLLNSMC